MATVLESVERNVILAGVSWDTYERLLCENQGSIGTRFNYDNGALEIMVLSAGHERLKQSFTMLVETIAAELGVDVDDVGSTTFRRKDLARGFEADASFYIQNASRVSGKAQISLPDDPPPDLAIEVDITNDSLDKLPIYSALMVPEVWRYDGAKLTMHLAKTGYYVEAEESSVLPGVKRETIAHLIEASKSLRRTEWVRLVRETITSLRSNC